MYLIYKCNSRGHARHIYNGDWDDFFHSRGVQEWGSTKWVPALSKANPRDIVIAYQTNRNELVGLAQVVRLKPRGRYFDLMLKPLRTIRVKVRPQGGRP